MPSSGGSITPDLFVRMRQEVERIVEQDGAYWTDQFHNTDALVGYAGLGTEIAAQVAAGDGGIDVFCAAVGTTGMLAAVSKALRSNDNEVRVVAFERATSPLLTTGTGGPTGLKYLAGDLFDA